MLNETTIGIATLAAAVTLLACGNAESQTPGPSRASAAVESDATGSGTLVWNAESWDFEAADCAFGGETEPRGTRTLVGVIETGDRQIFVEAGRSAKRDGVITHSLTVAFPEAGRPPAYAPTYFVNHIRQPDGTWLDQRGNRVDGPLFRIEGLRLSTPEVDFEDPSTGELFATGQLTATCD